MCDNKNKEINLSKNQIESLSILQSFFEESSNENKSHSKNDVTLNNLKTSKSKSKKNLKNGIENKNTEQIKERENVFKNHIIHQKKKIFPTESWVSPTRKEFEEREKLHNYEAELYKEKKEEKIKWLLFKQELMRLCATPISLVSAIYYLKIFFGNTTTEMVFSFIRDKKELAFLHQPIQDEAPYDTPLTFEERQLIFSDLNKLFTGFLAGKISVKICATQTTLNVLRLLYLKDFITECLYFGDEDEEFEVFFTKSCDPIFNNKFSKSAINWTSSVENPSYYTATQLKYFFFNETYSFTFGLVLTEKGFLSLLDCIHRNLGGELILYIYLI